jgi:septal ring-binding cell division protein DamX
MRFEIRTGGMAGILVGVLVLSGAVFVMGLLAGYDIGHESQLATQQVAVAFPIPPASSSGQAPAASGESVAPPPAPPVAHAAAPVTTPKARVASAAKPPVPAKSEDEEESADTTDEGMESSPAATPPPAKRVASAETPVPAREAHHKPFNIQIEAAMDEPSAQDMVKRLGALGYQPHLLPTQINGSTWYKVEVGPYTTQEEATAAEGELRKKYNSTYGGGGATSQPNDADQGPEE